MRIVYFPSLGFRLGQRNTPSTGLIEELAEVPEVPSSSEAPSPRL